jgi:hypothetical protein
MCNFFEWCDPEKRRQAELDYAERMESNKRRYEESASKTSCWPRSKIRKREITPNQHEQRNQTANPATSRPIQPETVKPMPNVNILEDKLIRIATQLNGALENLKTLHPVIENISELHKTGVLQKILDVFSTANCCRDAANVASSALNSLASASAASIPSVVSELAGTAGRVASSLRPV